VKKDFIIFSFVKQYRGYKGVYPFTQWVAEPPYCAYLYGGLSPQKIPP